jgi:uncharacterized protein (TIGR03083 family)
MDPWEAITPDREALAAYLATLTPADWQAPSWCQAWSVKDVAAHLLVPPTKSKGEVFFAFVRAGFNLDKMNARYVAQLTDSMSADQIVTAIRDSAGSRSAPPGLAPIGVLGDLVVHTIDIARAIGKPCQLPLAHYVTVLDHMKGMQPVMGCKKRIAGLKLKATDTDWSTGEGPLVEGTADLLLAAMTGRRAALASLTGPGVSELANR